VDTIYLIQNKRIPDQYKIGITGNWAQRSRQLEVGTKTTCVTTARVNDPRSLEKHLHRRFSAERLPQSEWFHLSSSQLLFVQSAFRKAESDCQEPTLFAPAKEPALVLSAEEKARESLLRSQEYLIKQAAELRAAEAAAAKRRQDRLEAAKERKAAEDEAAEARLQAHYNRPDVIQRNAKEAKVSCATWWGILLGATVGLAAGVAVVSAQPTSNPQGQGSAALLGGLILAVPGMLVGGSAVGNAAALFIKE